MSQKSLISGLKNNILSSHQLQNLSIFQLLKINSKLGLAMCELTLNYQIRNQLLESRWRKLKNGKKCNSTFRQAYLSQHQTFIEQRTQLHCIRKCLPQIYSVASHAQIWSQDQRTVYHMYCRSRGFQQYEFLDASSNQLNTRNVKKSLLKRNFPFLIKIKTSVIGSPSTPPKKILNILIQFN